MCETLKIKAYVKMPTLKTLGFYASVTIQVYNCVINIPQ